MLNKVFLMGRLTADPENRQTPNGISVTTFSMAVDRDFAAKGAERQTDFINIVAWRQTADFISRYFRKGNMIVVEGSIQTRKYQDKNGNNRVAFEVVASNVHFGESKNPNSSYQSAQPSQNFPIPPANAFSEPEKGSSFSIGNFGDFEEIETDDDLPF